MAGKTVKCPMCSSKIQIPEDFGKPPEPDAAGDKAAAESTDSATQNSPKKDRIDFQPIKGKHPSHVNIWIAGGIGMGVAGLLLLIVWVGFAPAQDAESVGATGYIYQLLLQRGWSQVVTFFLMFWCLAILVMKFLNILRQERAMLLVALPDTIGKEIDLQNLGEFYKNLLTFPKNLRNTYLINRLRKALEFFYIRQNNPEVAQMITTSSEVDAAKVAGSYSVVKVFLWAIPIMGFIGTVLGIGAAIGGFGAVLDGGSDMDAIKGPLQEVLGSMGQAFDTTLVALVFSIILSFPAASLQGREDDVVISVDAYCVDNLLKRLDDGGAASNFGGNSDAGLMKAIGEAISENQSEIMQRFEAAQKDMSLNLTNHTEQYEKVAKTVDKQMQAIDERAEKYEQRLDDEFFDTLDRLRRESVTAVDRQMRALSEGIVNLNEVLGDLNGKQVVVKKKGLFGR